MNLSQIQDLVRIEAGEPDMAPERLDYAVEAGRKEIESRGNFYWQASHVEFVTGATVADYDVLNDWFALDFKEPRFLFMQRATGEKWIPIPIGSWYSTLPETTDTATGFPERASYEGNILTLMDTPDQQYNGWFYYFAWTANPENAMDTDDLLTNHPQMMLTASIYSIKKLNVRNPGDAAPWEQLMEDEIEKAKALTNRILKEPANVASPREAAQILQSQAAK